MFSIGRGAASVGTFAGTAIANYRLSLLTKENELLFFHISVCIKQVEVCSCHFPSVPFSIYILYIYTYIYISTQTTELCIDVNICCHFKLEKENGNLGDFPKSLYCLLIVQTKVGRLYVC